MVRGAAGPPATVEQLNVASCLGLLKGAAHGRGLISVGCLPEAIPGALALSGDVVVLRSPHAELGIAGRRHDVITVEIDGREDGWSWTVHVTGVAGAVDEAHPVPGLDADWLERAHEQGEEVVAVPLTLVRGQRAWAPSG